MYKNLIVLWMILLCPIRVIANQTLSCPALNKETWSNDVRAEWALKDDDVVKGWDFIENYQNLHTSCFSGFNDFFSDTIKIEAFIDKNLYMNCKYTFPDKDIFGNNGTLLMYNTKIRMPNSSWTCSTTANNLAGCSVEI